MSEFAAALVRWQRQFGRKDLPWQLEPTPYRVWVSEIMLQQTQVVTVIDYYQRFMQAFPSVTALAAAELDDVLHHWTGLGYYARGRNLHKSAQAIVEQYNGELPTQQDELEALPGIGPSTAGAIRALSQNQRGVILDGNVKRVLARHEAVHGFPGLRSVSQHLWEVATTLTPEKNVATYTQAIMDLGAMICTRKQPKCGECPVQTTCKGLAANQVATLPTPKPKQAKPSRSAKFFLIMNAAEEVLLEQRPPMGLWGGLWAPLQYPQDSDPLLVLAELGFSETQIGDVATAASFKHTFTHFHLIGTPVYVTVTKHPLMIAEHGRDWHSLHDLLSRNGAPRQIGLPKPAVMMLTDLASRLNND